MIIWIGKSPQFKYPYHTIETKIGTESMSLWNMIYSADYSRYKEKHQGIEEAIEDHEHDSINELYFSLYRIAGSLYFYR